MREFEDAEECLDIRHAHKRSLDGEALAHFHRRLDSTRDTLNETQEMLIEIRQMLTQHIAMDAEMNPAIKELVTLWRGSKLMIPIMAGIATAVAGVAAFVVWAKDHVK